MFNVTNKTHKYIVDDNGILNTKTGRKLKIKGDTVALDFELKGFDAEIEMPLLNALYLINGNLNVKVNDFINFEFDLKKRML